MRRCVKKGKVSWNRNFQSRNLFLLPTPWEAEPLTKSHEEKRRSFADFSLSLSLSLLTRYGNPPTTPSLIIREEEEERGTNCPDHRLEERASELERERERERERDGMFGVPLEDSPPLLSSFARVASSLWDEKEGSLGIDLLEQYPRERGRVLSGEDESTKWRAHAHPESDSERKRETGRDGRKGCPCFSSDWEEATPLPCVQSVESPLERD